MAVSSYLRNYGWASKTSEVTKRITLDENQILYTNGGGYVDYCIVAMGIERNKSTGVSEYKVLGTVEVQDSNDHAIYTVPSGYDCMAIVYATARTGTKGYKLWIDDGV